MRVKIEYRVADHERAYEYEDEVTDFDDWIAVGRYCHEMESTGSSGSWIEITKVTVEE